VKKIGVLDIQGSVEEHAKAVERAGAEFIFVKTAEDLKSVDGLIMPGGESTTIGKLLRKFGLRNAIIKRVKKGMPVWGTCAGAILLAKKIIGREKADGLGLMNIVIERNAYGRQVDSFETKILFGAGLKKKQIPAIFIRAPRIKEIGKNVKVLARNNNEVVAALQKNMLITMFHPELTLDKTVHQFFIKMC
jgi:5'-phosphate synthase pdxT subunit